MIQRCEDDTRRHVRRRRFSAYEQMGLSCQGWKDVPAALVLKEKEAESSASSGRSRVIVRDERRPVCLELLRLLLRDYASVVFKLGFYTHQTACLR